MKPRSQKIFSALVLCSLVLTSSLAGWSETSYKRVYDAQAKQYRYVPEKSLSAKTKSVLNKPVAKQAAIGAAVGVAAGALSDKASVGKGAAVGAIVGASSGLLDSTDALDDKPLVKNTLKGAAIGTGVSAVTDHSKVKGAAAGAAAGAGLELFKKYLNKPSKDN